MANERFVWKLASKPDGAAELRKRNVVRKLTKDAQILCWVCGKKPKHDDYVYYPARTLGNTNEVIGHKDCVDRLCDERGAKAAGIGAVAHAYADGAAQKRRLELSVRGAESLPPATVDDVDRELESLAREFFETKSTEYDRGFRDGAMHAWAKLKNMLGEKGASR